MFDRYQAGELAVLVHLDLPNEKDQEDLNELKMLTESAGAICVETILSKREAPHSKFFVGTGKIDEVLSSIQLHEANLIIFNHKLTPTQERNIEQHCQCRVIDRTGLILDIFAQRARSHEGKLQVELAQLKHLSTRLVRGWTHLERQKGGIGLRGPGETQLETDRRLIRDRIKTLQRRLQKVSQQRNQNRQARQKRGVPTLSLVGYTNAGKSTLFNDLTEAKVYAADQLFATLDPTLRRIEIEDAGEVLLADTVGFIRHLPHDLIAAFKATLVETQEAKLLLHVVDVSDDKQLDNIQQVKSILAQVGAEEVPQLMVFNKIDNLPEIKPKIEYNAENQPQAVWISAQQGIGLDLLREAIKKIIARESYKLRLKIPAHLGSLRSALFKMKCVVFEEYLDDANILIDINIPTKEWHQLVKETDGLIESIIVQNNNQ